MTGITTPSRWGRGGCDMTSDEWKDLIDVLKWRGITLTPEQERRYRQLELTDANLEILSKAAIYNPKAAAALTEMEKVKS